MSTHPTLESIFLCDDQSALIHYFIEGLSRQGYPELVRELAYKTVELVGPRYNGNTRHRSPRLWEWYHPDTGKALGNCQYTWSALVIDLLLRFFTQEH